MASEVKSVFHNAEEGAKLINATTKFAVSLYTDLASSSTGNVFMSPISVSIALAMTYLGAKGNTLAQMKAGLHFGDVSDAELHQAFSDIREALRSVDGKYTLHTANRLFGQNCYKFLDAFLAATKQFYAAELAPVDFIQKKEEAVALVNNWVAEQTNQKIRNIVPLSAVDASTRLILVNAIYFKGDWAKKFDASKTKDEDFHVSSSEKVKVPLMHMPKAKVSYGVHQQLNCQAIEFPYAGDTLSMVILLPDHTVSSLQELESKLTADHLYNVRKEFSMHNQEVNIWLPRFKLEETLELNKALDKLGIVDLFVEGGADLSGMDGTKELYVSKVLHKAFIEVNEEGSEAAAATAVVVMTRMAVISKSFDFRADHPFLFFIRHNATNAILFVGRLMKP